MKDTFIKQCIDLLKREDIKNELGILCKPLIQFILCEIYPYLYILAAFIFFIILMILAILFMLMNVLRNMKKFVLEK
jgi:hypothetical protein